MGKSEEESENVWREEMGKFGDSQVISTINIVKTTCKTVVKKRAKPIKFT